MYPHPKNVREPFWMTLELQDVLWATHYILSYLKTVYFEGYIWGQTETNASSQTCPTNRVLVSIPETVKQDIVHTNISTCFKLNDEPNGPNW